MGALGGEDYSYYLVLMLEMSMRNPVLQKKLLRWMSTYLKHRDLTAAANIQASLEGDGVIAEVLAKESGIGCIFDW